MIASLIEVPCSRNGVASCGSCSAATKSLVAAATSLSAEDVEDASTLSEKN